MTRNLYSGILNVNSTLPAPFVTNALPSTGDATLEYCCSFGVTNVDISLPSKNAYNLMPGLKHSPVTVIVLGLTKGITLLI